jgi:hypothetical protein
MHMQHLHLIWRIERHLQVHCLPGTRLRCVTCTS